MQIAKNIFLLILSIIKNILDLAEFKMGKTEDFKYFRKQVFDYAYNALKSLFIKMESEKIIKKCSCNNKSLRNGYKDCTKCNGSGYENI